MSKYTFKNSSGVDTDLDSCYNPYTSGTKASDTGFEVTNNDLSTSDISNRYNKLGTTSGLMYTPTNYYTGIGNILLNNIFELNLSITTTAAGSYTATPITGGVLLKITAPTTLTFNRTLTHPGFVLVGGGGGGGATAGSSNAGAGGGAGEVVESTIADTNFYQIVFQIGAFGTGGSYTVSPYSGGNGGTSTIQTNNRIAYGANGGGGGGGGKENGISGGSGGGGGSYSNGATKVGETSTYPNPTGTLGNVNNGGAGQKNSSDNGAGGGGGGAGAVGGDGVNGLGGAGGNGYYTTNLVPNIILGCGGGGGGGYDNFGGLGGNSGMNGGNGGGSYAVPTAGFINTGTGGGGGENSSGASIQNGANGGSGVCYITILQANINF